MEIEETILHGENLDYDGEVILHDAIHIIFSYLNLRDLNQASRVCKSWHFAANVEKLKRGPQVIISQALGDYEAISYSDIIPVEIDDFELTLKIKPSIGLFFTDGKYPAPDDCDSVPYEICTAHQWTQPNDCFYIAIEAVGVNVDEKTINGKKNVTAALLFPTLPKVDYVIAETSSHCIEECFRRKNSVVRDISEKLFTKENDHLCLIVFIYQWKDEPSYEYYHNDFASKILDALKLRYDPGTYSLWGGAINDVYTRAADDKPWSYHSTSFCALGISGSTIMSWSLVINRNLTNSEIEEKLWNFKKYVRLKSSSIAFVISSVNEENITKTRVNLFKNIFPTITLISIMNDENHAVFSVNSFDKELNPGLKHFDSDAYMILTYKL